MARIRTIKPDFWRDEKICSLKNKMAAALFIGLWNISDDEGKFKLSAKSISLELPFFRTQDIKIYLRELAANGLIVFSVCSEWARVVNWSHQKIDKPHLPKVKAQDIQWLDVINSTNTSRTFDDHSALYSIVSDSIVVDVTNRNAQITATEKPLLKENALGSNSAQRFDDSYKPEILEFRKVIEEIGITSSPSLKRMVPDIARSYEFNVEDFRTWCRDIINSDFFNRISDNGKRSRYFIAALKDEIKK